MLLKDRIPPKISNKFAHNAGQDLVMQAKFCYNAGHVLIFGVSYFRRNTVYIIIRFFKKIHTQNSLLVVIRMPFELSLASCTALLFESKSGNAGLEVPQTIQT